MVPKGQVFEMPCCAKVPMTFEGYSEGAHELLLFDEAGPAQVIANKKLFQAQSVPIGVN